MAAELFSEAARMLTQERLVEIHVLETQGLNIRAIGRKFDRITQYRKTVFKGSKTNDPIPQPRD
jgi:hypothetical protein